jgi:hypothetical protein
MFDLDEYVHEVFRPSEQEPTLSRTASFAMGSTAAVGAVIWATGYRNDTDWVDLPDVKTSTTRSFSIEACLRSLGSPSSVANGSGRKARPS